MSLVVACLEAVDTQDARRVLGTCPRCQLAYRTHSLADIRPVAALEDFAAHCAGFRLPARLTSLDILLLCLALHV